MTQELNYDPWGRLRNPSTQVAYTPDTELVLFLGRGYTGHEHLTAFGLINMNARLYDPALGRFLSPDNFVQQPDNSQCFNRYSYCINNSLKYTDKNGYWFGIDDLIAAAIGGTINWAMNGCRFDAKGLGYFGAGAAAGDLALYGPAGWAAGGAILGASNAALGGANGSQIIQGAFVGAFSGLAGGAVGQWAGQGLGGLVVNGFNVTSPVIKGMITGAIGGMVGGYAGGFTGNLLMGGDLKSANQAGLSGMKMGAFIGAGTGAFGGYRYAKQNNINPWTGKSNNSVTIGEGMTTDPEKGWMGIDKISDDLGSDYFKPENKPLENWNTDTKLMQENGQWIDGKMQNNTTIYDRGSVGNNSQYYNMEMGRTMNYPVIKVTPYYNRTQTIRVLIIHK